MKNKILLIMVLFIQVSLFSEDTVAYREVNHPDFPIGGLYFDKKVYEYGDLPLFSETRSQMPSPIFEEQTEWVDLYWKAWGIAFSHFRQPQKGSGNVSNYIDEAFGDRIYLWDTSFMTMFCNVAYDLVPGIQSLDNFYAHQFENGEISCQLFETTGGVPEHNLNKEKRPFYSYTGWHLERQQLGYNPVQYLGRTQPPPSYVTLDRLDHPISSWAELEHFRYSGDLQRLGLVYQPLVKYFEALDTYLRQGNGLYITDWASMDNSPRNKYLKGGGCGIDISAEMAMVAGDLSKIATLLNETDDAQFFKQKSQDIKDKINELMWHPRKKFYYDLTLNGKFVRTKTIAGFWTLLARVPTVEQAELLVKELNNPRTFNRKHRVPTVAANQRGYNPKGGYWKGAVWAPTQTMVVRGLENYGYQQLAKEIALNHLSHVNTVYKNTGTIWENYASDVIEQGQPSRKDFVGWSGIGPILYLLEYAIGLKPDAVSNQLNWHLSSLKASGCRNYRFNGIITNLIAEWHNDGFVIEVDSDKAFTLSVEVQGSAILDFQVEPGANRFIYTLNADE